MLDSVDPKVRLSKATELVDRHLQVCYLLMVNLSQFNSSSGLYLVSLCITSEFCSQYE